MNIIARLALPALTWFLSYTSAVGMEISSAMPDESQKSFPVSHFLDDSDTDASVVIKGGKQQGIMVGSSFTTFRKLNRGGSQLWVATGSLQVTEIQNDIAIARVTQNGSDRSRRLYPKFPGVMAGDTALENRVKITKQINILPTVNLTFNQLFEDPKSSPQTFELSASGKSMLQEQAAIFAGKHLPVLLVEGYTDEEGPKDANFVESYQRAQTVRQFLIQEMGFTAERVLAVGQGENETSDRSYLQGYQDVNRRIVIKALPGPGSARK